MIEALRQAEQALDEQHCWISDGTGRSPASRGAKCETSGDVVNLVTAALTSIRQAIEGAGWRGMDSAPKDGMHVDVWTSNGRFTDCWFCDKRNEWMHWWFTEWGDMGACRLGEHVSHWMPLPPPPQEKGGA